jgi:DNA polymerase
MTEEMRQQLAARVRFYRELGIDDFYLRPGAMIANEPAAVVVEAEPPSAPFQILASDKPTALAAIRSEIGDCIRCRLSERRNTIVFADGNSDADIMFVGEGPGADEDEQGLPFVGKAGQLLNNMITAMGIRREDVYIANVVKCRPPGNRTPERDECDTCGPFLMQQIETVRPKIIVALGATAAKYLLNVQDSMANLRGKIYDLRGIPLAVTYHPAYLLRDPRQKKETWADLQMVMRFLGMSMPEKKA